VQHIVAFEAGHDCIQFECKFGSESCVPGGGGSHGRAGLGIRFVCKGTYGAVQFLMWTDWTPQYAKPSSIGLRNFSMGSGSGCTPVDLGFHAKSPQYEGQTSHDGCEYCDGEPCFYDGSALNANDAMYALVNGGDAALWRFLEGYYASVFLNQPYPVPEEYTSSLREERA